MASKRTKTSETTADTSIYLSIVAKDHDDFVRKITELYLGICQPAPVVTKEQVRDAINGYAGQRTLAEGRELVQKVCGVDVLSLSQIPEAKYGDVVAAFRAGMPSAA